jgi:hypothetical protein
MRFMSLLKLLIRPYTPDRHYFPALEQFEGLEYLEPAFIEFEKCPNVSLVLSRIAARTAREKRVD